MGAGGGGRETEAEIPEASTSHGMHTHAHTHTHVSTVFQETAKNLLEQKKSFMESKQGPDREGP